MSRLIRRLWECAVVGFEAARSHWRSQRDFDRILDMGRRLREYTDGEAD